MGGDILKRGIKPVQGYEIEIKKGVEYTLNTLKVQKK
tara:strand:+ start:94270 stop:94380 length:111 start_codon:yes stop_codon:yes gene_type:complete